MTYYEEFGVAPDATNEEIRQAYRALARLIHPDVHSDERLRTAAERQMRRINAIFDTLISPEKRRSYDESLLRIGHSPHDARSYLHQNDYYRDRSPLPFD